MKSLSLINKAFLLKKTTFFHTLDLDQLLTIADKMELLSFAKGEKIFARHQEAKRMYIIVEGRVNLLGEEGKCLGELGAKETLGDEALFHTKARAYDAICSTPTTLLALSRSHLFTILLECPTVALSLLEAYTLHLDFRKR